MSKGGKGYTVIEVLIFIAVSSLMFITAMIAINGRQQQVQFSQGTREFDAKIRDIINDVTTGYYPANDTVSCQVVASEVQIEASTGQTIGTNSECIYIGKVLQFNLNGVSDSFKIYNLAGKRFVGDDLTPTLSIDEAAPKAVTMIADGSFVDPSENFLIPYGLKVTKVISPQSDTVYSEYGAIAIVSNFGGSSVSEGQSVQIGGIVGSQFGASESDAVGVINSLTQLENNNVDNIGYMDINRSQGIVICLESSRGSVASITLGKNGSSDTELQLDNHIAGCDNV